MLAIDQLMEVIDISSGGLMTIQILANDPRSCPTEGVLIVAAADDYRLSDLEELPAALQDECGWLGGYQETLNKTGGGIGADGIAVLSLAIGAVGAVPAITSIFRRLGRSIPSRPGRDEAYKTATWAVALQYKTVERRELQLVSESKYLDHWTFKMALRKPRDEFVVEVYGSRSGAIATAVTWTNGDPWGPAPGLDRDT